MNLLCLHACVVACTYTGRKRSLNENVMLQHILPALADPQAKPVGSGPSLRTGELSMVDELAEMTWTECLRSFGQKEKDSMILYANVVKAVAKHLKAHLRSNPYSTYLDLFKNNIYSMQLKASKPLENEQ